MPHAAIVQDALQGAPAAIVADHSGDLASATMRVYRLIRAEPAILQSIRAMHAEERANTPEMPAYSDALFAIHLDAHMHALRAICRLWPCELGRILGACDPGLGGRVSVGLDGLDLGRVDWRLLATAHAPAGSQESGV